MAAETAKSKPQCPAREGPVRCELPKGHQSRHANTSGEELVMWRNEPESNPVPHTDPKQ